ncbi:GspH/FimT family pseudopilin [Hirschia baltica]|uniref:Type II secretion system protein H n=1 Tax=Hirschia baltica (strain ATCC 49814 / DSM 5838 / IFAM 1418) TaxID=582402 RepID=C6XJ51_HIRBI|nr:GspH/FimT family pseudopilin [Hirschia baltica]ACT59146.1 general secretion pathway protein H [Hirschia baltica ATCC 49814]
MDQLNPLHKNEGEFGFTLVELLVVIFIIGLMSGVVVMSMPERQTDSRAEAEQLTLAIASLSREAIASGEAVSWTHVEGMNLFERYHGGDWVALNGTSRALEKSKETKDLTVRVTLLGMETERKFTEDQDVQAQPPLVFFPTGEATPAEIEITAADFDSVHKLNASGQLIFIPVAERVIR